MFRYSRDVKRCGPGTKAGAAVGALYCLRTSSFFILMLALELTFQRSVSARQHARGVQRRLPVRTFGLVTASRVITKSRAWSWRPRARPNSFALQQSLCPRLQREAGIMDSGFFGLDGRPRFSKALAHPIKNDLGRFAARPLDQFRDILGILDRRLKNAPRQFRLLGRDFLRRTAWLEVGDQLPRLARHLSQDFLLFREDRTPALRQRSRGL